MLVDSLPGVEVTVQVNKANLAEYPDEDTPAEPGRCTRYVQSTTGAKFGISINVSKLTHFVGTGLSVFINIDGVDMGGVILEAFLVQRPAQTWLREGRESNMGIERWAFATLNIGRYHSETAFRER